ncbi:GNAT family N-acetyltransferase [Nicoliella spurrieriana]|uniref:GNAT family N-acetyltransferase n=1 Tax=Nicoliella spurrieriana TaxID=2925830 RepID=A0A976RSE3_9LACO|nr:GNAT family N-acetyltransferase [Nicoliella spurrieriana]UQS86959.1 GNAT family N-acetyltransferase [Nicoliella spurrieriana]
MANNDESVSIELATGTDAPAILKLMKQLTTESDTFTVDPGLAQLSIEQEQRQIMLINQTRSNVILVAHFSDEIIGVVTVQQLHDSMDGELGVAVLKQFWNNGIGTALVDEALNWGTSFSNLTRMVLTVENQNQAAIHVYHRLGFVDNLKRRIIAVPGNETATTEMTYDLN